MRWMLVAIMIAGLGFALRLSKLAQQAVWWDEAWSVTLAELPLSEITPIIARDAHPPLYQWLMHGWIQVVGISEFAVRYLSVLAGTLTIVICITLTHRLLKSRRAALIAGLLVAVSLVSIIWSQEARMYALGAMWAAGVVYACILWLETSQRSWAMLLVVAAVCAPLSQYLAGFAVVAVNLHALFTQRTRFFWVRWLVMMGVAALLVGGWIGYALTLVTRNPRTTDNDLVYPLQLWGAALTNGESAHIEQFWLPSLLLGTLALAGLTVIIVRRERYAVLIGALLVLPPFFFWLVNSVLVLPLSDRYYALMIPTALVALTACLNALMRLHRVMQISVTVIMAGLFMFGGISLWRHWDARYYRDDYESIVRAVNLLSDSSDTINFISGERYPLINYYFRRLYYPAPTPRFVRGVPSGSDWEALMPTTTRRADSLWLLFIERVLGDRDGAREAWYRANYSVVSETSVDYNGYVHLTRNDADADPVISDTVLLPVVKQVRPFDWIRVGVPAHTPVTWAYGTQEIASSIPDQWDLLQFRLYPAYPNGLYRVQMGDVSADVTLTHSQPFSSGNPLPVVADFGVMQLNSFALPSATLTAGQTLPVTLTWTALQRSNRDLRVFVHLTGAWNPATNSPLWAQSDGLPVETPLSAWWDGLSATETRTLYLPADLPDGTYTLSVGLYDATTSERLTDSMTYSNTIILTELQANP